MHNFQKSLGTILGMLKRLLFAVDNAKSLVGSRSELLELLVDGRFALALASYPCGSTGICFPTE